MGWGICRSGHAVVAEVDHLSCLARRSSSIATVHPSWRPDRASSRSTPFNGLDFTNSINPCVSGRSSRSTLRREFPTLLTVLPPLARCGHRKTVGERFTCTVLKHFQFCRRFSIPCRCQFIASLQCGNTSTGRQCCGGGCRGRRRNGSAHQRRAKSWDPTEREGSRRQSSCRNRKRASGFCKVISNRLRVCQSHDRITNVDARRLPRFAEIRTRGW